MKKLIYFIGLIFFLSTNVVMAQSFCGIKIIKEDGEPECLLTAYEEKTAFPVNDDFGDDETTLVCRGKTVTYTANNTGNSSISSYEWTVNGSDNYTITNNGKTITVTWDDPTAQQVSLQVTATSPEGVSCTDTKYMYIVETPVLNTTVIQGYIENPNGVKTIRVCNGETVEFIDNSQYVSKTNVTGYYWGTDNYGNASTKNFKIENISVPTTVTHKIMSYCGCEAEEVFLIEVLPERAIQLSCHGTACEGSIVTYEPEGITCSQYNWVVENGTIIGSSTAPQVKVQWGAPESGYGIISLDGSECEGVCPKLVPVKIPIISSNVVIAGSENACEDESVVFELPLWGSTEYIWEITPSIPMLDADHPNKKIITFSQKGTYTLTCKVRCPFLDCGELTVQSKTITVKPRLNINGKSSICAGGSSSFTTNATSQTASSVEWTLSKNKQTLATYIGSTFNYTFTQSGNYQLEAINSEYCNTAVMYIDVHTLPLPQIAGNNNVCVYDGDSLTVTNANSNYWVKWSCNVPGASPQNLTSDNSFVVKFNGVVGNVTARFEDNNGCLSDVATFEIHEFQLDDLTPFLPTQVTGKKTGDTIHLQIPKQHGVFYRWSVPSGRATLLTDFTSNNAVFVVNRSKDGTYPDFQIRLQRVFCNDYTNPTFDYVTVSGVTEANITISGNKCTNNQLTFSTDRTDTDDSHYTWTINGQTYTGKTVNAAFTTAGHKVVKLKYQLLSGNNAYIQTATLNIKNCTSTNSLGELEEAGDIVSDGTVYETNNDLPSIVDSIDHPFWEYYASCNVYFDCDSNQIVVNEIKYGLYSGITVNPSSYLLWKKDNGNWVQVPVHSFSIPLSSLNIDNDGSTITVHFFDGYSSCTREITVYPPVTNISATITHPSDNSNLCSESPYLFTANVSGDYDYCYWDFGNGSVMEGDTVEYAYVYASIISNEYWVTIVAVDKNGCEHRLDSVFYTVGQSPVLGTLVSS
ncbi:MAG: hypothetical protein IJ759_07830, partial [Bacteroidales bacterium]|nr:hypothetical protein [Bacteroidales bacterium]